MEIIIPLPQYDSSANTTYRELKSYLKQLELAVHHAQKSVENAEKDGIEITEDSHIIFEHSMLEYSTRADGNEKDNDVLKNFVDNYYEELQHVELKINLA